ncbi:MAG: hypothetical protein AAF360_18375 [Pseudomonadota bacterium]
MIGGRVCIDICLRFEELEADFARLGRQLGQPVGRLPRHKADRRLRPEPYADYYDAAARRRVARASAFELAYFGYDFAGGPHPQSAESRVRALLGFDPLRALNGLRPPPFPKDDGEGGYQAPIRA